MNDFRCYFTDALGVVIYLQVVKDGSKALSDGLRLVVAHIQKVTGHESLVFVLRFFRA